MKTILALIFALAVHPLFAQYGSGTGTYGSVSPVASSISSNGFAAAGGPLVVSPQAGNNPITDFAATPGVKDHQIGQGFFGSLIPYLEWWSPSQSAWNGSWILPDLVNLGTSASMTTNPSLSQLNVIVNGNSFWLTHTNTGGYAGATIIDNCMELFNYHPAKYAAISFNGLTSTNGSGAVFTRYPAIGVGNFGAAPPYANTFFMDGNAGFPLAFDLTSAIPGGYNGGSYTRMLINSNGVQMIRIRNQLPLVSTNLGCVFPPQGGMISYGDDVTYGTNIPAVQIGFDIPGLCGTVIGMSNVAGGLRLQGFDNNAEIAIRDPADNFNHYYNSSEHDFYTGGAHNSQSVRLKVYNTFVETAVPAKILGVTDASDQAATFVGQYVTTNILSAAAVSLSTGTAANVTNMTLTAGDWDVTGTIGFKANAATTITSEAASITSTSATLGSLDDNATVELAESLTGGVDNVIALPTVRISISSTTKIYLVVKASFAVNTLNSYGGLRARRIR